LAQKSRRFCQILVDICQTCLGGAAGKAGVVVIKAKILLLMLVNIGSGKGLLVEQATNTMGYRHRVVEYAKGVEVGGQLGLL
jgi:hypothetical protein